MVTLSTGITLIISKSSLCRHGIAESEWPELLPPVHDEDSDLLSVGPVDNLEVLMRTLERRGLTYIEDFIQMGPTGGELTEKWSFRIVSTEAGDARGVCLSPAMSVVVRKSSLAKLDAAQAARVRQAGDIVDESDALLVLGPFFDGATPTTKLKHAGLRSGDDFVCLAHSGGIVPEWCEYIVTLRRCKA